MYYYNITEIHFFQCNKLSENKDFVKKMFFIKKLVYYIQETKKI